MQLWRYAHVTDPYFGPRSCWALTREFADQFNTWNSEASVQELIAGTPGAGPRRLYVAELQIDATVLDIRSESLIDDFTPQDIESWAPELTERGIRWVIWHEGLWEGTRPVQAIYFGTEPVNAVPADV